MEDFILYQQAVGALAQASAPIPRALVETVVFRFDKANEEGAISDYKEPGQELKSTIGVLRELTNT
jgi:hypothetical protein